MRKETVRLFAALLVAAALWFWMFSPWTCHSGNFWLKMSLSAAVLLSVAVSRSSIKPGEWTVKTLLPQLLTGIATAAFLWCVFWIGDKLSQLFLPFARSQVDSVYGMKDGTSAALISLLLIFFIGPAEELFWRGYVQKSFSCRLGPDAALVVTTLTYGLVHVWSLNLMLIMAALVAGAVWGLIYRIRPSLLPALVVSHALWDAMVFVFFPI